MRIFLSILSCIVGCSVFGQSPHLSILVKMDSVKAADTRYKIEMKTCEIKSSVTGDWFTHDTSKIDFAVLNSGDLVCGKYFGSGLPTLLSGQGEKKIVNQFIFTSQFFAWEHIFIYKISNISSRGLMPEMYLVVPVRYKSFRTRILIDDIDFQPGKVIFLNDLEGEYDDKQLVLSQSLKNRKGVSTKNFSLREILESK